MRARLRLMFLLMVFVICEWKVESVNKEGVVNLSLLYQRVQSLKTGLIENKNLDKYAVFSVYSTSDNKTFIDDRTKVTRSYNTEQCIKDLKAIQEAFHDEKTDWANEMMGAWGEMPPVGFDKDYGNFDKCHDLLVNKTINIETQYCLAGINAGAFNVKKIITPISSQVGICIPNSCAPSLITNILNDYLDSNKSILVNIAASDCRFKNDNTTLLFSHKIFIAFLTMIFGLVILSSIYDIMFANEKGEKNQVLMAFSAYTNIKALFACKSNQSRNAMSCLDGMRAIAALWIIATHFNAFAIVLVGNPRPYTPVVNFFIVTFTYGHFSVDTFFVLSSTLAACKMLNELSKNGRLNIPLLYLQRILRLSPVMIFISLFNRFLLQFCANGPTYRFLIDDKRESCETTMWDSIFFFDNFYNLKQCIDGGWYLCVDMQFYLVTPFLVLLLHRYPKRFIGISAMVISIDTTLAWNKPRFGLGGYIGYTSTHGRITPWLIGVNLAYILVQVRSIKSIRIAKFLNILLLIGSLSVYPLFTCYPPFIYADDIWWRARTWWSLAVSYIIFACVNRQGGIVNWILSRPFWQPISRLSFNTYLTHMIVMWFIYANRKVSWYISPFTLMQELFLVISSTCAAAVVLSLMIEMPFINLSRIYLTKTKKSLESKILPSL